MAYQYTPPPKKKKKNPPNSDHSHFKTPHHKKPQNSSKLKRPHVVKILKSLQKAQFFLLFWIQGVESSTIFFHSLSLSRAPIFSLSKKSREFRKKGAVVDLWGCEGSLREARLVRIGEFPLCGSHAIVCCVQFSVKP